jgi:DNA repair exonuclease SbcCD nuclease subunit
MGHVHKYQVISKIPFVSHVGSLNISDFGEAGAEKNIVVFDIDRYPIYNIIPIPIRQLRKISVSVPKEQNSTEFVLNEIKNMHDILSMRDVTVKIEVKLNDQKAESINRELIEKFLYNIGVHYISNISESKAISVVDLEKVESVDNSITPEKAIKIFAEHESFESEDDRERYLKFAAEIIEQQKVKK